MRIYLYTLISPEIERTPISRTRYAWLRNRTRRALDFAQWKLAGRFLFHYQAWEDRSHTNEGDIAIREAVRSQFARLLESDRPELVPLAWQHLDDARVEEINRHGDALVVAGGYFHFSPAGDLKAPLPDNARLFERIRCPIVIYGAGANCRRGPGEDPGASPLTARSEALLRRLLSAVSLCAVRDEYSARLLERQGGREARVVLDPAMLLEREAAAPEVLDGVHIGLNFGFHGPHSESLLRRNLPEYIAFARRMHRSHGACFHYFVHSDGEELVVRLLRSSGIRLDVVRGPALRLLESYRRMTLQISHMMHSTILSLSVGTPAISLAYDVKNASFYRLMELDPYCIDARSVSAGTLVEAAERILGRREDLSRAILRRKQRLALENHAFLAEAALRIREYAGRRAASSPIAAHF